MDPQEVAQILLTGDIRMTMPQNILLDEIYCSLELLNPSDEEKMGQRAIIYFLVKYKFIHDRNIDIFFNEIVTSDFVKETLGEMISRFSTHALKERFRQCCSNYYNNSQIRDTF